MGKHILQKKNRNEKMKGDFIKMKWKSCLSVVMSILVILYSAPVYTTNAEGGEETKEVLQTDELEKMRESVLEISSVYGADEEIENAENEKESSDLGMAAEMETNNEMEKVEDSEPETEKTAGDETEDVRAADDIASGTYENITWVIDKDGKLTVTGTGEFAVHNPEFNSPSWRAPWAEFRESILSAEVSIKHITDLSYMFFDCKNMTSIDLSKLETSDVTDMSGMFTTCSSLTNIDVSNFNTNNVTNMSNMFRCCIKLENIDVSKFNTGNVTDMQGMFYQCWKLGNIDVSKFNTGNVRNMCQMFYQCMELESIDISGFNTSKVENISYIFADCNKLKNIDLNSFDTGQVTDVSSMLNGCTNLEELDLSNFDLRSVEKAENMFANCLNLHTIQVPKNVKIDIALPASPNQSWYYNETEVTSLPKNLTSSVTLTKSEKATSSDDIGNGIYENITWVIDKNGKLTVTGTGEYATLSPATEDDYWTRAPWYEKRESILSAEINVTGIRDTSCMFRNCTNIKSIDVKNLDTSQVSNMEQMFYGCASLENLDTSGFQTGNVILMDGMFEGCTSLKTLDVSVFNTQNVTWMANMFKGCSSLKILDVSGFDTRNVWKFYGMFEGCSSLENINASSFSTQSAQYLYRMFYECSSLKSITFGPKFDTKDVTDMARMFYGCSSLESIDVSEFHTGNVTHMQHMFRGCSKLKTIKFGDGFDTSKVTDMLAMFRECGNLESLDLSVFRTDSVTCMANMFAACSQLKSVNVSNFNTDKVTEINSMFWKCGSLSSLDLSSFNLSNVTEATGVFTSCENLNTIQTPKNVMTKIVLPVSAGTSWYHNEVEITELPQNLSTSVKVTKGFVKNPDEPITPEIITTKLEDAIQNVPYEIILQNNGWDAASYRISQGALPEGIALGTNGVIYGITKESGTFQFTVVMTVDGVETSAQKTFTLNVLKSTDRNVDAIDEPGYEIIQPIPDINMDKEITDQLFISNGPFDEFRNAYIDGDLLIRDIDYTAESGSTRITIKSETLDRLEKGKHTLGVEFRTKDDSLKRVAQNFDVNSKKSGQGSSSKGDSTSGTGSASSDGPKVTTTAANVMESVLNDAAYYSVILPSDNAILRLSFFNKVYGNNATILAYLDNGIGYNLNMNAFLAAGKDLNLSTKETELDGFAQGFKTIWLSIAQKTRLNYDLGLNLMVGAEYAGHPVYVFIFDDVTESFVPHTETVVTEYGNIGFHTRHLTDFIVMTAQ